MKTPGPHLSLEYSEAGMWAAALSRAVGGVFQGTVNNEGGRKLAGKWNVEHAAGRKMPCVGVGGSLRHTA